MKFVHDERVSIQAVRPSRSLPEEVRPGRISEFGARRSVASMPRRKTPDPLAEAIGQRIRQLRQERGLTAESVAFGSDVGSKGFLSDIERGLAMPSLGTLKVIAEHLGVELLDLVTFPERSDRLALVDQTRALKPGTIRRLLREMRAGVAQKEVGAPRVPKEPAQAKARTRRQSGGARKRR